MKSIGSLRLFWAGALLSLGLSGCAVLPEPVQRASHATPADTTSGLGRLARDSMPPGASSAVRPLVQAGFSLDARLALIRHAEHTVDLQYYLLQDDEVGRTLLHSLREAAQRGVRIRLLVDDLYTAESTELLRDFNQSTNVEVRLFNPFPGGRSSLAARFATSLVDFARVNHRMHNKLFIADGAYAVAGGRNIGNEYFRRSPDGNFLDFDVLIAGQAVPELATVFDRFWNSRQTFPLETFEPLTAERTLQEPRLSRFRPEPPLPILPAPDGTDLLGYRALGDELPTKQPLTQFFHGKVQVFSDRPEKVSAEARMADSVTSAYLEAVQTAQKEVIVVSPYFVPGDLGMAALRKARARGVRIKVITNAIDANDEPFAAAAYARYRTRMLELGVELFEESAKRMRDDPIFHDELGLGLQRSHAKLTVIDDRAVFVGSMNLDLRSARTNTELGLLIESPELALQAARALDLLCHHGCYSVRLSEHGLVWVTGFSEGQKTSIAAEPTVGAWTRLKLLLFSRVIPDALL